MSTLNKITVDTQIPVTQPHTFTDMVYQFSNIEFVEIIENKIKFPNVCEW